MNKFTYKDFQPYVVVFFAAIFYLYDFFLRVSPSVVIQELMVFYNVGAGVLGPMISSFFLSYTLMQIPAGLLGDKFGPKIILTLLSLVCSVAIFLFINYNYLAIGFISRFLIGFCASFAYIAPLMLAARWFDSKYFALICGLIQMMGCLGAIIGGAPVVYFTDLYGWQYPLFCAGVVGIILSACFMLFVKDFPKNKECPEIKSLSTTSIKISDALKQVCQNKQTWVIGLIGFAAWSPVAMFAELWGVSFLEVFYQIETIKAAKLMRYVWVGIAVGGPVLGWFSHKIKSRKTPLVLGLLMSLVAIMLVLYIHLPFIVLKIVLFIFGFSASCQCVTFGAVRDINPLSVSGTAVGFNNMSVILGGVICQPMVGVILEYLWDGNWLNGAHIYTAYAYQMGFLLIPLCSFIGIISVLCFFKDTHGKKQY